MKSRFLPVVLTAALTSLGTLFLAARYQNSIPFITAGRSAQLPVNYANFTGGTVTTNGAAPVDFQNAAEGSVKAVVHIKTSTKARAVVGNDPNDLFGSLFGQSQYYI